ncbi:isoprenylcysteine carboxylmethyltransferase family protein [Myxococcus sp. AM009]|uniref:methyltransferase family protein n=1 Tax=Myxococcus sp. AM009 TaxID=2745137 RepID=UPI00159581A7|nr:isoprenylcysteine carboxylmethyltransferase family protein [Myxococcus sp. AM009]NVI99345.1 isoprenylcysteine carboxylmethyltransferase family protein [Myxococcus sp. AM009]
MQRLLPPRLALILAALMAAFDSFLPGPALVPSAFQWLGLPLVVLGLGVAIAARAQFARARTNIYTFSKPDYLVTDGLFRFTRNPMYLGFCLALTGLAVFLGSLAPVLCALAYLVISDRWYIAFEEEMMRARFGEAYQRYARHTRRWL